MIAFASSLDQRARWRKRRGLRPAARRDERLRRARLHQRRAAAAGYVPPGPHAEAASQAGRSKVCASACRRRFFPTALRRGLRRSCAERAPGRARAPRRPSRRRAPARTELVDPVYYLIAPAEASSNCRASTASATATVPSTSRTSSASTRRAQRGLRRRGESAGS
jgi:hypothetical protein